MNETGTHAVEILENMKPVGALTMTGTNVSIYDRALDAAIKQEAPLDQLEKFLQLKREHEAHEARKEFYQAVADFKGESVVVVKDKVNTQFKSKYTTLGNLLNTVNPVLGKHGLSVAFDIEQTDKIITVACNLRHRLGHSEAVRMSAPPDTSGGASKNPIQQIKSTITYLRAATFEAVTGLASTDATLEDDGNAAGGNPPIEYISGQDLILLKKKYGTGDDNKFFQFAGSTGWNDIPVSNHHKILDMLNQRNVAMAKKSDRVPGEEG